MKRSNLERGELPQILLAVSCYFRPRSHCGMQQHPSSLDEEIPTHPPEMFFRDPYKPWLLLVSRLSGRRFSSLARCGFNTLKTDKWLSRISWDVVVVQRFSRGGGLLHSCNWPVNSPIRMHFMCEGERLLRT